MSQPPTNSEQLSAWLDGELEDAEAAALERELERDARLRAELDELREVREMLRTHGPRKAPNGFHAKIMARVEDEPLPANNSVWLFLRRPFGVPIEAVAVAAAALFVVLAGLNLGSSALEAPLKDIDFGSRRLAPDEAKEGEAAAPVAPEQTIDPSGGDYDDGAQQKLSEPQPKAAKKEAPPAKDEAEKPVPAETTAAAEEPKAAEEGTAEAPTTTASGTKGYDASAAAPSGWSFIILTSDDEIVATLQRIAAQNGGQLRDNHQVLVTTGALQGGESGGYFIRVKASQLSRVVEMLRRIGANPKLTGSETFNPGQMVDVRVDVMLEIPKSEDKKARPSTSTGSGSSGSIPRK